MSPELESLMLLRQHLGQLIFHSQQALDGWREGDPGYTPDDTTRNILTETASVFFHLNRLEEELEELRARARRLPEVAR